MLKATSRQQVSLYSSAEQTINRINLIITSHITPGWTWCWEKNVTFNKCIATVGFILKKTIRNILENTSKYNYPTNIILYTLILWCTSYHFSSIVFADCHPTVVLNYSGTVSESDERQVHRIQEIISICLYLHQIIEHEGFSLSFCFTGKPKI